jgi:hypothetical protein
MRIIELLVIIGLAAAAGCGTDKSSEGQAGPGASQAQEAAQAPGDPAGAASEPEGESTSQGLDPAVAAKLQGNWIVGGSTIGAREAWQVQGDKVTIWNGKTEKTLELAVTSPCTVKTTEKSADGSSSSTVTVFVFDGDTLYQGLGSAGLRNGGLVVACMGGGVYTYQEGTCVRWEESMFGEGKWDKKDAECKVDQHGQVFEIAGPQGGTLQAKGNVFMTEQMADNRAEKFATWEEAKAALTRK